MTWILFGLTRRRLAPPPWDFSVVDFAQLESAAHRSQEATDDWVAAAEPVPERVRRAIPLTERQMVVEIWWGSMGRPF